MLAWRRAYFILGAVSPYVLIPISAFIVRRSLKMWGSSHMDMEKKVPVNMGKTKAFRQTAGTPHWSEARKTPILWMFVAGGFLIYFTSQSWGHMSYYLQTTGFDPSSIAAYISVYSIVAPRGKAAVLGHMFDRFGPKGGILFGCGTFLSSSSASIMVQGGPPCCICQLFSMDLAPARLLWPFPS